MRAAVFHGPKDIRLEEIDTPTPGADEVVIQVGAVGICGSDLEYYTGSSPLGTPDGKGPLVLGHELSGRVVQVGSDVDFLSKGQRVAVNPVQGAHHTDVARSGNPNFDTSNVLGTSVNGALAEFVVSRADACHLLPDSITDEQGAFVEMLASSVNAVEAADIGFGDFVVIYGPGPVGLAQVQLAKLRGGVVLLVGTRDSRLKLGSELGADFVANVRDKASKHYVKDLVEFVRSVNSGSLADRALVATTEMGACQEALAVTGEGSIVVYMGLSGPEDAVSLPLLTSLVQAKQVRFAWLYPHQWPKTIRLLQRGLIDTSRIISHVLPLDQINEAIQLLESRDDGALKVVIKP